VCEPRALPFTDRLVDMSNKLEALRVAIDGGDISRLEEFERVADEGYQLANAFDDVLCKLSRRSRTMQRPKREGRRQSCS